MNDLGLKEQCKLFEKHLHEQCQLLEKHLREDTDRFVKLMGAKADEKIRQLEAQENYLSQLESKMEENAKKARDLITLNIGGTLFMTTKATLLKMEGSYFYVMLASGKWLPNNMGTNAFVYLC